MNTLIVQLKSPDTKIKLNEYGKTGNPVSITDLVILETDHSIDTIRSLDFVEYAEIDQQEEPSAIQESPESWFLPNVSQTAPDYHYDSTGKGVNICVIDDGVRLSHEDFDGRAISRWSYDDKPFIKSKSHGTRVASCAAGTKYGIAKEAMIHSYRTQYKHSQIIKSLDMILDDHKKGSKNTVINMSFNGSSNMYIVALKRCYEHGIILVGSTGNKSGKEPMYPAKNPFIVSVGASDEQDEETSFSNKGGNILAPGFKGVAASTSSDTSISRGTFTMSGTSFSAPLVAGVFAMNLQGKPKLTSEDQADKVVEAVLNNAREVEDGKWIITNKLADLRFLVKEEPKPKPPSDNKKNESGGNNKIFIVIGIAAIIGFAVWQFAGK